MINVAIVEDNKTVRESLETIVNLATDCRCVGAWGDAEEALRMVRGHEPDVVLMDVQLPKMSGVECAAQMKERLPGVQIVMLTVYEDPDRIFHALRAGACGYLLKRSTPEQIIAAVREVHHGGAPMTSEIARKVLAQFRGEIPAVERVANLSTREREVLQSLAQGLNSKAIADRLSVSVDDVRCHLKHIYLKLHAQTRACAAVKLQANEPEEGSLCAARAGQDWGVKTPHLGS